MKSKKMVAILSGIALTILLVAGCGFHQRFNGGDFQQHVLEKLDSKMDRLELTEDQQQAYAVIRERMAESMKSMQAERQAFLVKLKKRLNQQDPDVTALAADMKEKLTGMSERIGGQLDDMVELYNMLDDRQKTKVIEHFRDKLNRCSFGQSSEQE